MMALEPFDLPVPVKTCPGSGSMKGFEMEKQNFDNETHKELEPVTQDFRGFLIECGSKAFDQPWGMHGRPLTNAFNVSAWLLYKMAGRDLSTDAILQLVLRLPLPSDVAGHVLLFPLRQQHCSPEYKAMFYLKAGAIGAGLHSKRRSLPHRITMLCQTFNSCGSNIGQYLSASWIPSVLCCALA